MRPREEYGDAVARLSREQFDWLKRLGASLPEGAFARSGFPGTARVRVTSEGLFDYAEDGVPALVLPVADGPFAEEGEIGCEVVDLVAWNPHRPADWWPRHGTARFLGEWNIERARFTRDPLRLFRTPFAWLKSGAEGACLLRLEKGDYLAELLEGVKSFVAEDTQHAGQILRALKRKRRGPRRPDILVPKDQPLPTETA